MTYLPPALSAVLSLAIASATTAQASHRLELIWEDTISRDFPVVGGQVLGPQGELLLWGPAGVLYLSLAEDRRRKVAQGSAVSARKLDAETIEYVDAGRRLIVTADIESGRRLGIQRLPLDSDEQVTQATWFQGQWYLGLSTATERRVVRIDHRGDASRPVWNSRPPGVETDSTGAVRVVRAPAVRLAAVGDRLLVVQLRAPFTVWAIEENGALETPLGPQLTAEVAKAGFTPNAAFTLVPVEIEGGRLLFQIADLKTTLRLWITAADGIVERVREVELPIGFIDGDPGCRCLGAVRNLDTQDLLLYRCGRSPTK